MGNIFDRKNNTKPSNESGLGYSVVGTNKRSDPRTTKKFVPVAAGIPGVPPFNPVGSSPTTGTGTNPSKPASSVNGLSAPKAPTTPTGIDLDKLYADLTNRTRSLGDTALSEYDAAQAKIKAQYALADKEMYDEYNKSRAEADAAAAGLGITNTKDLYAGRDNNARKIQENSNQSLADHQAFFDKMRTGKKDSIETYINSLEVDKTNKKLEQQKLILDYLASTAGGGGGGGSKSGGGGSDKTNVKETATATEETFDPAFYQSYLELKAVNPKAAEQMYETYLISQSKSPVVKALTQQLSGQSQSASNSRNDLVANLKNPNIVNIQKMVSNIMSGKPTTESVWKYINSAAYKNKAVNQTKTARDAALATSGLFNNPRTTNKVTTTGKTP